MKIKSFRLVPLFILLSAAVVFAEPKTKEELAQQAISTNTTESAEAIKNLRLLGKDGLDALFLAFSAEISKFTASGEATEDWKRIAFALDSVAQQKDAYASHLFWYTDLEEAKKAADAKNKPILSLRLLGNLNEEFSCANSRLFRAILYPNAEISKYLSENYILHWKSVRPAPKITIDFGDGRKIERTLTGNSIHYILDEEGEIIDALPGLYSPKTFLKYLTQANQVNKIIDGLPASQKDLALLRYRQSAFKEISTKRRQILEMAKVTLTEPKIEDTTAVRVAPIAATKMMMTDEISILRVYDDFARFEPQINLDNWNKLAKFYSPSPKLDSGTTAFVRRQTAKTGLSETEFSSLLAKLENFVALDTTRNDFLFHMKLYEWLNENRTNAADLEKFNSRVYADIFKTPDSDKWLGLYNTDVYTALDGNGIIK